MVREDLNPVEEARACAALVEDLGLTKEELARRVGRSRPAVSNLIRLLELPDEALELLESGELSEGHGRALLGAQGNDVRRRLARDAVRGGWSVRETENRVRLASQPKSQAETQPVDPEEAAAWKRPATTSSRRSATRSRSARARTASPSSSASTTSARPTRWPARCASTAADRPPAAAIIAVPGRLAQLVRARL